MILREVLTRWLITCGFFLGGKHLLKAVACEIRLQFKTVKLTDAGAGSCG